jgi:hypothetical protein
MSNQCVEGNNNYKTEREKYINKTLYIISKIVAEAQHTHTPSGLLWSDASERQQEEILLNTYYNGQTLKQILHDLITSNNNSELEIIDMNKLIEKKSKEIDTNNLSLNKYNSEIAGIKNLEYTAKAQLNDSELKYKATESKYTIFLGVLIVLILCEIGYVYFYLKSN